MRRAILVGWVVFPLVGAGAGICLAMLFFQEPAERATVSIEHIAPLTFGGALAGAFVGCVVSAACLRWPKLVPFATVASVTLLGVAVMAPFGWIVGDTGIERLAQEGMVAGAVLGGVLGFVLGLTQALQDHLKRPRSPDV